MTLQSILDNNPTVNFSQLVVFTNGDCVYDYKEGQGCIELLADKNCSDQEQVTLYELLEYSDECSFTGDDCYFRDEDSKEYFSSYDLDGNKINLKY